MSHATVTLKGLVVPLIFSHKVVNFVMTSNTKKKPSILSHS